MYQIYTLPICEHCSQALKLMREKEVQFEQINAGSSEGIKRFRDFYTKQREQIRRDDSGCVVFPVIIYQENENVRMHQGTDGLEKFLGI